MSDKTLLERFTENAERFDALMTEMLAENERMKIHLSGLLDALRQDANLRAHDCPGCKGDECGASSAHEALWTETIPALIDAARMDASVDDLMDRNLHVLDIVVAARAATQQRMFLESSDGYAAAHDRTLSALKSAIGRFDAVCNEKQST